MRLDGILQRRGVGLLKSKHYNTQAEWLYVWNHYQDIKSQTDTEAMIADCVAEIRSICKGRHPAFAWSGGKDSIALQIVCEDAGIEKSFCCYNDLYFAKSIDFFKRNAPNGCVLHNSGEDIKWLAKHPDMLFPKVPHRWNIQTHLKYQPVFCREHDVDILLMGKRSQDMNHVPKEIVAKSKDGIDIYCPIRKWTHEDVICAIRYRNKSLSPIYFTEEGFHYGDTKFAVMGPMKGETEQDAWRRIYVIEPEKVIESATWGLRGAREFLRGLL